MTVEEARKEIPNIDSFCHLACNWCRSEWYCPTYCDYLEKARKLDFERILKCYAKHDGDINKVCRYIKNTPLVRKKGGY